MSHTMLLLALGDVHHGDDAFGPRVLADLQRRYALDPRILTVETASIGMRLLPVFAAVQRVLLITTVHLGSAPATLHRLAWHAQGEDLGPRLPAIRRDGIELLRTLHFWVEQVPDLVVLGLEGDRMHGPELSPLVALAVRPTAETIAAELRRGGLRVTARTPTREPVTA
jgi:hydrogenase maturation protease